MIFSSLVYILLFSIFHVVLCHKTNRLDEDHDLRQRLHNLEEKQRLSDRHMERLEEVIKTQGDIIIQQRNELTSLERFVHNQVLRTDHVLRLARGNRRRTFQIVKTLRNNTSQLLSPNTHENTNQRITLHGYNKTHNDQHTHENRPNNDKHTHGNRPNNDKHTHGNRPNNDKHTHGNRPNNDKHTHGNRPNNDKHTHGNRPNNDKHTHGNRPNNDKHTHGNRPNNNKHTHENITHNHEHTHGNRTHDKQSTHGRQHDNQNTNGRQHDKQNTHGRQNDKQNTHGRQHDKQTTHDTQHDKQNTHGNRTHNHDHFEGNRTHDKQNTHNRQHNHESASTEDRLHQKTNQVGTAHIGIAHNHHNKDGTQTQTTDDKGSLTRHESKTSSTHSDNITF